MRPFLSRLSTAVILLLSGVNAGSALAATTTSSREALVVHASSSASKNTVLRVVNTSDQSGTLTVTAWTESGAVAGSVVNASLGTIGPQQTLSFTSAQLEAAVGYTPPSSTSKYRVTLTATLPNFELLNWTKDVATGAVTLSQAQSGSRYPSATTATTRDALVVHASTSPSKNSVLRVTNLNTTSATLTATLHDEAGAVVGTPGATLGTLGARQTLTFTSAQLEAAAGYAPPSGTSKYRVTLGANLPDFELLNWTKDVATGEIELSQVQSGIHYQSAATNSVREALVVHASSSPSKNSLLRVVNLNDKSGTLTATAHDEAGHVVGTPDVPLAMIGAQQTLTFTSAQLEAALGYVPASTAKYRVTLKANLPSFELINWTKDVASGAVTLSQAQPGTRYPAKGSTSMREALVVHASSSPSKNTVLRVTNLSDFSGPLTVTAHDESGRIVGSVVNASLGALGPQQTLTFTSAQLEAAVGYTPPSGTSKYRLTLSANVPSFELLNWTKDVATGAVTLSQEQTGDPVDVLPVVSLVAFPSVATAPANIDLTAKFDGPIDSIVKIDFYNGTTLLGSVPSAPNIIPMITVPGVPAGTYDKVKAVATDANGFVVSSAPIKVVVLANVPPTVSLSASPASPVAPANITLTAAASDSDGTIDKVDFYYGTTLLGSMNRSPYTITVPNVGAGVYANLRAVATDNKGASTSSPSITVTVK